MLQIITTVGASIAGFGAAFVATHPEWVEATANFIIRFVCTPLI